MSMSLEATAEVYRDTMRDEVRKHSLRYMTKGVLLVAAGFLAIVYPVISSVAFIVILGWLLVLSGVFQGISLIGASQVPHFWLELISVALALIVGFLLLRDPTQGLLTITLLLIVFLLIQGISKIVFALTIRPFPAWGWVLASGVLGVALAVVLWASLPGTAAWLIGLLVGIELIGEGAAIAYLALLVRKTRRTT